MQIEMIAIFESIYNIDFTFFLILTVQIIFASFISKFYLFIIAILLFN